MQSAEDGTLWYALHVRTRFEKVVSRNLQGKGYEEFLPLYKRTSNWSDRKKVIELPLFPGYVFCRFNAQNRLPILTIPGVNAILGIGKTVLPVEEREINDIRTVLDSNSVCLFVQRQSRHRTTGLAFSSVPAKQTARAEISDDFSWLRSP